MNNTDETILGAILLLAGGMYLGMVLSGWLGANALAAWLGLSALFASIGLAARKRETPEFHVETCRPREELPQRLYAMKKETERAIPSKTELGKDTD